MDDYIKEKLRKYKLDVLGVLHTLCVVPSVALETEEISKSTGTAETDLRGILSTIRRLKISGEPLIQPAGRDVDGKLRWRINQKAISKDELANFLEDEIIGEDYTKKKIS